MGRPIQRNKQLWLFLSSQEKKRKKMNMRKTRNSGVRRNTQCAWTACSSRCNRFSHANHLADIPLVRFSFHPFNSYCLLSFNQVLNTSIVAARHDSPPSQFLDQGFRDLLSSFGTRQITVYQIRKTGATSFQLVFFPMFRSDLLTVSCVCFFLFHLFT